MIGKTDDGNHEDNRCVRLRRNGYAPFLIGDKWQVAFLNYAPEEALESIVKLDVHHYTDEVFVLLDGRAALIGAQVDDGGVAYEAVDMRPLCAYNIRRGVWHKIAMQPGSRVLIVENCNTHLGDFEFLRPFGGADCRPAGDGRKSME